MLTGLAAGTVPMRVRCPRADDGGGEEVQWRANIIWPSASSRGTQISVNS